MSNHEIAKALDICIPSGEELADTNYRQGLISRYLNARTTIDQFLNLEIPAGEFLEKMECNGLDIDGYFDSIAENLPGLL